MFGDMPSYAFLSPRQDIAMDHMKIDYTGPGAPGVVLEDVQDVRFDHLNLRAERPAPCSIFAT